MTCSRCQASMIERQRIGECSVDIADGMIVAEVLLSYLHETYHGALCGSCITEIHQQIQASDSQEEFYFDREYIVFTTSYHFNRGYCCRSKCRHCPYGYR
jgi:hypothetical protein